MLFALLGFIKIRNKCDEIYEIAYTQMGAG